MVDITDLLAGPRLLLGALLGLLLGLGVAYVIRSVPGAQVAVERPALVVALGIMFGPIVGARNSCELGCAGSVYFQITLRICKTLQLL